MVGLILFLILITPASALATSVCIDIPSGFVANANEICSAQMAARNLDSEPTSIVCLESVIRERVINLATRKIKADAAAQGSRDAQTELETIVAAWPEVLDYATCGDEEQDAGESCDGTWDTACPGDCTDACCCIGIDPNCPAP